MLLSLPGQRPAEFIDEKNFLNEISISPFREKETGKGDTGSWKMRLSPLTPLTPSPLTPL